MNGQNEKLLALLDQLEHHGGMYLQPYTYDTVVAFLSGYDLAIFQSGRRPVFDRFRKWLQARAGTEFSMAWPPYIRQVIAKGDDQKALRQLFALLREFSVSSVEHDAESE